MALVSPYLLLVGGAVFLKVAPDELSGPELPLESSELGYIITTFKMEINPKIWEFS